MSVWGLRMKKIKVKRIVRLKGTDIELNISKAVAVKTASNMIHFDQLKDGTWRIIYNGNMIPDFSKIESFDIIREG